MKIIKKYWWVLALAALAWFNIDTIKEYITSMTAKPGEAPTPAQTGAESTTETTVTE
jgi:hypothetical protein